MYVCMLLVCTGLNVSTFCTETSDYFVVLLYTVSGNKGTDSTLDISLTNSNIIVVIFFCKK